MQYIEMKGLTEYKAEYIYSKNSLEVVKLDKRRCISKVAISIIYSSYLLAGVRLSENDKL